MPKPATATARLNLLLPWLNGDFDERVLRLSNRPEDTETFTDPRVVRPLIDAFVRSFDGSAGAGHLAVGTAEPTAAELEIRRKSAALVQSLDLPVVSAVVEPVAEPTEPTDEDLEDLRVRLQILLEQGFGDGAIMGDLSDSAFPLTSLTFAVRSAGRRKPTKRGSIIDGGVTALRNYQAAGAYVLHVQGPTIELVPFLVAHLLTAPDMVAVKRCKRRGCEHFIVTATAARGAPKQFCSAACREWNRELEQQRKTGRRK